VDAHLLDERDLLGQVNDSDSHVAATPNYIGIVDSTQLHWSPGELLHCSGSSVFVCSVLSSDSLNSCSVAHSGYSGMSYEVVGARNLLPHHSFGKSEHLL
jgi:hypothetical protein